MINAIKSRIIPLCLALCAATQGGAQTLDEVIDGISESENLLFSGQPFYVRVQRQRSEVVTPSRYGGGHLNVEYLVAYKAGQYLCSKLFLSNELGEEFSHVQLPKEPTAIMSKDGVLFRWQKTEAIALVHGFEEAYGGDMFQCLDYFRNIGLDAARHITESNGGNYKKIRRHAASKMYLDHPYVPSYLSEHRRNYAVLPQTESVDGHSCLVLEMQGMDKIWIDPECGYSIRRRVYHFAKDKPRQYEIWNKDIEELSPGLWLPRTQIVDVYANIKGEDEGIWDKVVCRQYYEVIDMSVGDVPDDLFDLEIRDGLMIADQLRGIEYSYSSGGNSLDRVLSEARKSLGWKGFTFRLVLVSTFIAIFASVVFLLMKNSRRKQRNAVGTGMLLLFAAFSCGRAQCADSTDSTINDEGPKAELRGGAFNWFPRWREPSDCGPCSLYALAWLQREDLSLESIKELIEIDNESGCSIADLVDASNQLGFPVEARFVRPSEIYDVELPFILHGKLEGQAGHFLVIIAHDEAKELITAIDAQVADISTNPTDSILTGYSGYVIVPKGSRLNFLAIAGAIALTTFVIYVIMKTRMYRPMTLNRTTKLRRAFTMVELLVVISIIAVVIGLLLPAVQMARESARRTTCNNRLKQLSLAVLNLESAHQQFPSGGWGKNWAGMPGRRVGKSQPGGWIFQVLPFIEQQSLAELGGIGQADRYANRDRLQTAIPILHCPSRRPAALFPNPRPWTPALHATPQSLARNDYAINGGSTYIRYSPGPANLELASRYAWADMSGNSGLCFQRSTIRVAQVTDGLSNTYLLGEKQLNRNNYHSGTSWGDNESAYSGDDRDLVRHTGNPTDSSMKPISDSSATTQDGKIFGSAHPTTFTMSKADGSVHQVSFAIDQRIHSHLGSRNDNRSGVNGP